jgi:predicted lactoylglutathione lyase
MENLLDHIFLAVRDVERSKAFYSAALAPLGITYYMDFDGSLAPGEHANLYGFARNGRSCLWLMKEEPAPRAVHIGYVAASCAEVDAFYEAAMAAGATDKGAPSYRAYYHPQYYAANILDLDGYSVEVVYKDWQH